MKRNPMKRMGAELLRRGLRGLGGLDPTTIQAYAATAGFTGNDLATAVAIALAESGGNPSAVGDTSLAPANGPSIGLWQINIGSRANPQYASANLADPQTNANAAFALYSARGFQPWSTYTNGAYQAFLNAVPSSPATAPGSFNATAPPPGLTIDADTGLPVDDSTPTPIFSAAAAAVAGQPNYLILTAVAVGIYILGDLLEG